MQFANLVHHTVNPEITKLAATLALGYVIPAIRAYSGLAPVR